MREGAAREVAPSSELGEKRTLRHHRAMRSAVVDRTKTRVDLVVVRPALDGERALPDLRQHHHRIEYLCNLAGEAEPFERRVRDDHRVVAELGTLAQPGLDVAA